MKPPIGETAAILCFWTGALLLLSLAVAWRSARRSLRRAERQWAALDTLLADRRERLFGLPLKNEALIEAFLLAESARGRKERVQAEREIDRLLREAAVPEKHQAEIADWERRAAVAAERYDEAAEVVNAARHAFPAGVVLRALAADPLPLYGPE